MFFALLSVLIGTLISLSALFFTVEFTSPKAADGSLIIVNLVYFFVASFISLAGTATLVLYWLGNRAEQRVRKSEIEAVHRPKILLKKSLRRGFLLATALVGIGLLNSLKFSNPLNIILLISAVAIIEIYFFGH